LQASTAAEHSLEAAASRRLAAKISCGGVAKKVVLPLTGHWRQSLFLASPRREEWRF